MAANSGPNSGSQETRPAFNVSGRDIPALSGGLLSMLIVENSNGLYRCEALFGNWGKVNNAVDFIYFDRKTLDFGKSFKIMLGNDMIFDGKIMALEANFPEGGAPQLNVLAEDRFQALRMTRRTRTFSDLSDADLIQRIANDHGLTANTDVQSSTHKILAQVNQSDLAFLRERARAIDAELWMDGDTLHVQSHPNRSGGVFQMAYQERLKEFSVLADLAGQRTALQVCGWDVAGKSELKHEADDSVLSGELSGDVSGASILASAFGPRKESVVHTVPLNSQETQASAEAFFKMGARRFVVGRGVAQTDSRLRVGSKVDLQELGPLFSGKYYLSEVRHLFDGIKGLRTEFTAERPGLGR